MGRIGMEGERVLEEAFRLPRARLLLLLLLLLPASRGSCLSSPGCVLGVPIGLDRLWLNFLPPFPPLAPCLWTIILGWLSLMLVITIQPDHLGNHKCHYHCCADFTENSSVLHQLYFASFQGERNPAGRAPKRNWKRSVEPPSSPSLLLPTNHRSFPLLNNHQYSHTLKNAARVTQPF